MPDVPFPTHNQFGWDDDLKAYLDDQAAKQLASFARPVGNVIGLIADSLGANGGGSSAQGFTPRSWLLWAQMFSGGIFTIGRIAAHGGYTSTQAADLLLPQMILANPPVNDGVKPMSTAPVGQCIVGTGTNDPSVAAMIAGLTRIYDGLLAAGIQPIAHTLPPRNDVSGSTESRQLHQAKNRWIRQNAAARGFALIDFYSAPTLTDPATGGWRTGLNPGDDAVHPNDAGAKAMGAVAGAALAAYLKPWHADGPVVNNDPDNLKSHPDNTLMLTTADGGRRPEGWYLDPAGATGAVAARTGYAGNRWSITRNAANAVAQTDGFTAAFVAGHTYLIRFRLDAAVNGGGGNFGLLGDGYYAMQVGWSQDIPVDLGAISFYYTAPTGLGRYTFLPMLNVEDAAGSQAALSEFAIYDHTAVLASV